MEKKKTHQTEMVQFVMLGKVSFAICLHVYECVYVAMYTMAKGGHSLVSLIYELICLIKDQKSHH